MSPSGPLRSDPAAAHNLALSSDAPGATLPGARSNDPPGFADPWAPSSSAMVRIVRVYVAARAVLGVVLIAAQAGASLVGVRTSPAVLTVGLAYALQAVILWLLPRFQIPSEPLSGASDKRRQWLATIGFDLLAFTLLHALESGSSLNFAALLVLPVLMAGVISSQLTALATSAAVSIVLLLQAWWVAPSMTDLPLPLMQAGLAGLGMFFMTLLAAELSRRLAGEEQAARGSLEIARQQAQLNRLVIEEMADGVLVIDRQLRVWGCNPAARALMTGPQSMPSVPFSLLDHGAWRPLTDLANRAWTRPTEPSDESDVSIEVEDGTTRRLRVRSRFTTSSGGPEGRHEQPFCVLLLEDLRLVEARLQQDKLVAMGRMSAGIAHEIRNPLAAISQANSLMLEDARSEHQARLLRMVGENVRRLQRIVEDVLEVAPGAPAPDARVDAEALVLAVAQDWARTSGQTSGASGCLHLELTGRSVWVVFDADHLRRVLLNLLDNAFVHGRGEPGSIRVQLQMADGRSAVLSVLSDGPPIAPEVERHLFEPFFSTRSRGSGLGLYISRELCRRHGANLEFWSLPASSRHRNGFVVTLTRAADLPVTDFANSRTP